MSLLGTAVVGAGKKLASAVGSTLPLAKPPLRKHAAQVKSQVQFYLGLVSWELRGNPQGDLATLQPNSSASSSSSRAAAAALHAAGNSGGGFIFSSLHGLLGEHEFRADLSHKVYYQIRELHLKSLLLPPSERQHYHHLIRPDPAKWHARDVKRDMMVQIRALVREPLGRVNPLLHYVTAFEHFELTTFPLVVCLPHDHALLLRDYFLPEQSDAAGQAAKVKAEAEAKFTQAQAKKTAAEQAAHERAEKVRRGSATVEGSGSGNLADLEGGAGGSGLLLSDDDDDATGRDASLALARSVSNLHAARLAKERAARLAERKRLLPSIRYFKYLRINDLHFTVSFRHLTSALFTFENVHLRIAAFTQNKRTFAPQGWSALVSALEKHIVYSVIKHGTEILAQKMGFVSSSSSNSSSSAGTAGAGGAAGRNEDAEAEAARLRTEQYALQSRERVMGAAVTAARSNEDDVSSAHLSGLLGVSAAASSAAASSSRDRLGVPGASPSPPPSSSPGSNDTPISKRSSLGKLFGGLFSRGHGDESEEERAARKERERREKEEEKQRKQAEKLARKALRSSGGATAVQALFGSGYSASATPPALHPPHHAHSHSFASPMSFASLQQLGMLTAPSATATPSGESSNTVTPPRVPGRRSLSTGGFGSASGPSPGLQLLQQQQQLPQFHTPSPQRPLTSHAAPGGMSILLNDQLTTPAGAHSGPQTPATPGVAASKSIFAPHMNGGVSGTPAPGTGLLFVPLGVPTTSNTLGGHSNPTPLSPFPGHVSISMATPGASATPGLLPAHSPFGQVSSSPLSPGSGTPLPPRPVLPARPGGSPQHP